MLSSIMGSPAIKRDMDADFRARTPTVGWLRNWARSLRASAKAMASASAAPPQTDGSGDVVIEGERARALITERPEDPVLAVAALSRAMHDATAPHRSPSTGRRPPPMLPLRGTGRAPTTRRTAIELRRSVAQRESPARCRPARGEEAPSHPQCPRLRAEHVMFFAWVR